MKDETGVKEFYEEQHIPIEKFSPTGYEALVALVNSSTETPAPTITATILNLKTWEEVPYSKKLYEKLQKEESLENQED